jgi:hypothetical protein
MVKRWRSVRATPEEKTHALPGDELIKEPIGSLDHAITIRRARQEVWPWLAQMGAGSRAGWYSYDFLDNGRRPSAERIIPELQKLAVGMIFPALPGATDGFTLLAFEPQHFLVLGPLCGSLREFCTHCDPHSGPRRAERAQETLCQPAEGLRGDIKGRSPLAGWTTPDGARLMTWAHVLEDGEHSSTRLVVRARAGPGYRFHGLPWWATKRIVAAIHFVMQRKQLLGIARRVERGATIEMCGAEQP